jgi:hypothetical protein
MPRKEYYEGDTSAIEDLFSDKDFLSGISPKEYDYIYNVRFTYEERAYHGFTDNGWITINNLTGREIVYICSLRGKNLHLYLLKYAKPYHFPKYEPNNEIGFTVQRIVKVEKTLVSTSKRSTSSNHSSSYSSSSNSSSSSSSSGSSESDWLPLIGGTIMMIIGACIFFYYARDEFGIVGGIFYSLFWFITLPIHYFFF